MNLPTALMLATALAWVNPGSAETWTELAPLPETLREFSTAAIPGRGIATIGGVVTGGVTTNLIQLYDITKNVWSKAGVTLPIPINHGNVVAVNGNIYLLMGMTSNVPYTWIPTRTSGVYESKADSWTPLEGLPAAQARGAAAMGVYKNIVYMAGGKAGTDTKSVDSVSAFNTTSGTWIPDHLPEAASRLPEPRDHVGGVVVGHKFYVVGGRDTATTNVKDTVWALDLDNLAAGWVAKAKMPTARGGMAVAAVGTKIYTFGGEGNQAANAKGVFDQTEAYDTETDKWSNLGPMKTPRHGASAAMLDGKIYIPGGGTSSGRGTDVNILESFTP